MRLKDKVCIITGSGNGIGKVTALKFAEEGAKVIVCDVKKDSVDEVVKEIEAMGGVAVGYKVDVTKNDDINAMVKDVMEKFGKIDSLVNNAGIIMDAQLHKMTEDQFDKVININLKGTYNCTRAIVDIMIAQGFGSITNASSVVGVYGNFGQTNYAATKWGVIGMAKSWAKELGRKGIRANAVAPGFIATPILDVMPEKIIKAMEEKVPMKRLGKPEEIANVYAFLASDEASYINGAVIEVSGGVTL
ncbi:3-oxoacyl-[acyl-carrier-protein] reductase [Youngiibacter multivorans]|uniref:3-oxoacyl-[acyl-carrier-protein] reductase n=1 Tax=Youngiibacter multivorans TaxID=937251 RepID=A0ABS4G825_9CLOT|nr:3-oxoacyl-[acyl-carrier-protein] reductase [Youngiibacter multivorans]MBP1920684.1 3-oxoacyl-[acyl-carrier protein] reductase [Youngiibacter multivorans]